jgi:hypothetical protein
LSASRSSPRHTLPPPNPQNNNTLLEIVAITNPLTREAQRMSQVLGFVRDVLGSAVSIQLHLNPRLDLSDMPLKTFYR